MENILCELFSTFGNQTSEFLKVSEDYLLNIQNYQILTSFFNYIVKRSY